VINFLIITGVKIIKMKILESRIRRIINEEVISEIGPHDSRHDSRVTQGISGLPGPEPTDSTLIAKLILGFTPVGVALDAYDMWSALVNRNPEMFALAAVGFIPGIGDLRHLTKSHLDDVVDHLGDGGMARLQSQADETFDTTSSLSNIATGTRAVRSNSRQFLDVEYRVTIDGSSYYVDFVRKSHDAPVEISFIAASSADAGELVYNMTGRGHPFRVLRGVLDTFSDFHKNFPNEKSFIFRGFAGDDAAFNWGVESVTKRTRVFRKFMERAITRDPELASVVKKISDLSWVEDPNTIKIDLNELRRIIREELLIESPIDIPGGPHGMDPMQQAELERTGAADVMIDQLSDTYTVGELVIDFGSAIAMGTVEFVVDVVNARLDLQVNLMQAVQSEPDSEERAHFLTESTNNALDIAMANLMWYGPGIVFSTLRAGTRYMWPAIKNIKPSSRAVPTPESQSLLKEFRADLLTDDFIAAAGADRGRLQKAADIIDDAIKANDKFKYQRPSYSAAVKDQRARDAIVKIRDEMDDLYWRQIYASGENPIYAGEKPPPLEKIRWDHLIRVSNEKLPPTLYPVFAEKLSRKISENISRLNTRNVWVMFEEPVENLIGKTSPIQNTGFLYDDVIKYWEKIPGNPQNLGFKDLQPQSFGFYMKSIISDAEARALGSEMIEQFPGLVRIYGGESASNAAMFLADDVQELALKAGHTTDLFSGNYTAYADPVMKVIEIAPWKTPAALETSWRQKGVIPTIKSAFSDEGLFAHEFDHMLRAKVVSQSGGNWMGATNPTLKRGTGTHYEQWLSKHTEFEAEFTQSIKEFLDQVLERGWTDELNVALTSPSKFETYFLQNMQDREWLGAAGKDGMRHVRRRLFDTETGLYYSLRTAMGIADPPRGPLPETVYIDTGMWNIIAGLDN